MSLLHMSFYGAILIVAIIIIRAVALHRLPKKVFVLLWSIALLRLLLPFSIPSEFSLYSLLPGSDALSDALTVPRTVLVTGNPSVNFLAPIVTPLPGTVDASDELNYYMAPDGAVYPEESVFYTTPFHAFTSGISILISPYKELFVPFETFFWIIGLVLFSVFFAVTYFRCYREFQTSLPVEDERIAAWLADHPTKRTIQVRQSDRISAPLTYGIFDPVILLPKNMDLENEKQLHYVLYHEYSHIRHFDSVLKLVMVFTLCIHWFNPLVWVMYVLFNRDMEFYCDECVLASEEGDSRSAYANTLIHMEETRSPFMPFCNHFSKSALEERITSIMKSNKVTLGAIFLGAVIVLAVLFTLLTSAKGSSGGSNPGLNPPSPTITPTPSATPAPTRVPPADPTVTPVPGPQYADYFMPIIDTLHNNDISVEFTRPSSQLFIFREGSLEFTEPSQENAYTLTFSKLAYTETDTLENVSVDLGLYFSKYAWAPNTLHYREETRCIYISYTLAPHKQPINGPSILLIEIPVDEPQAYTVIPFGYGYETDLYQSALWFTEAYLLDNLIYYNTFSHEGTLWAINLDTKQLFSLSHVNSTLNSAALEHLRLYGMDETYSICTAVCYKQGNVTVYSGTVSKETDTPVLFTVYLAYDGDTLIDTLYLDTIHMGQ